MLQKYKSTITKVFVVIFLATNIDSSKNKSRVHPQNNPRPQEIVCFNNIIGTYETTNILHFRPTMSDCMFLGLYKYTRTMMNLENDHARMYYNYLGESITTTDEMQSPSDWCMSHTNELLRLRNGTTEDNILACKEELEQTYGTSSVQAIQKAYFEVAMYDRDSVKRSYHDHLDRTFGMTNNLLAPMFYCRDYHSGNNTTINQ